MDAALSVHGQISRSAKPEWVGQSFQEPFAQPGSPPTFRTSSSGKTFLTKHREFQSELVLASMAWEREHF